MPATLSLFAFARRLAPAFVAAAVLWADAGIADTRVVTLDTGRSLNLFSAPSTEFAVVGGLSGAAIVEVRESWNDWLRVEYGETGWGWAGAEFLRPVLDPAEWREVADPQDPDLNLRAGPGTGFDIVYKMPNGTRAFVLAVEGGWRFVRHETGQTGWAWAAALAVPRPAAPAALPQVPRGGN